MVLLSVILLYAALLRLDAITAMYGPASSPGWLHRIQESRSGNRLRPAAIAWYPEPVFPHANAPSSRYRSDPYTYLQYARQMRSFYAAHRREPLFPFTTKLFLKALADQDVAVSFASAAFSLLAIAAAFVLGTEAYSIGVGGVAASLMAIEYDAIYWSCGGWRDDAFTFGVVLSAWALLRCGRDPLLKNAVLLGVSAAVASLVRITAISFIVPAALYLVIVGSGALRQRVRVILVAAAIAACLVGPYVLNCWRSFGDPLYAINVHADVYRASEGQAVHDGETAPQYLAGMMRSHPVRTLDTFVLGMSQYPFTNKWTGFDRWVPSAGKWLAICSLAGLLAFASTPEGRLLLVVLAGSLVPFAFTWRLVNDWRFTEHAYPFLLMAAALTIAGVARAVRPQAVRDLRRAHLRPRTLVFWSCLATAVAIVWLAVSRVLPPLTFKETLRAGESAVITAGQRDAPFFESRWTLVRGTNLTTRVADEARPAMRVPLPASAEYDAFIRLDADDHVSILFNGQFVAQCAPGSTRERMGTCRFRMPAGASHAGFNRITFVPAPPPLRVWYLRVQRAAE
jgi:hypothetical protein